MKVNHDALRELRSRTGFTVGGFATELEVTSSHISNIEAGRRQASPKLILAMARLLKVPLTAIIRDPEPEPEQVSA